MTKASEADLIQVIADRLDPSQRDRIQAQCETMRNEFRASFDYEISTTAKGDIHWIPRATNRRARLLAVGDTCRRAAKAVAALQDDHLPEDKFELQGRQFELFFSSTKISTLLWLISERAGDLAEKLKPKARSTLEQDATAYHAFVLVVEFGDAEPSRIPKGAYLTVAKLLFEYFTGIAGRNLEASCRKVLSHYGSHRRAG